MCRAEALSNEHQPQPRSPACRRPGRAEGARLAGHRHPQLGPHRRHRAGRAQAHGEKAAHILVTTPESLYILLGSESGRAMLKPVKSVIVDEIHAVAPNKRGAHLALSLERLAHLCGGGLQRIGCRRRRNRSRPWRSSWSGPERRAVPPPTCTIIDTGHRRDRDLAIELPVRRRWKRSCRAMSGAKSTTGSRC